MSVIPFDRIFPIQEITDEYLVNGNGDVTAGYSVMLPEIFTQDGEKYEVLHQGISSAIKKLLPGTVIHKQDFFFPYKYDGSLESANGKADEMNRKFQDGRNVLRHYSDLYITFSSAVQKKVNPKNNSFLRLSSYLVNKPFKGVAIAINNADRYLKSFETDLSSLPGIGLKRKSKDELKCALVRYLNQGYDKLLADCGNDPLSPVEVDKETLRIGGRSVGLLTFAKEGEAVNTWMESIGANQKYTVKGPRDIHLPVSLSYPVCFGLPFKHVVNTVIEIMDNEQVINWLRIDNMASNTLAGFGYDPAKAKINQVGAFIDTVTEHHYSICRYGMNVIVDDISSDSLEDKMIDAENAFGKMLDARAWQESYDLANLFYAFCPGNVKANYRSFLGVVEQGVCYLNKETQYRSDPHGVMVTDRFGEPVVLNLWDSIHLVNRNGVVFGPSGTGKSYTLNHLIDQLLASGNEVIVIDVGGSYKRSCMVNEGYYFDSAERKNLSFNIFLGEKDENGNYLAGTAGDEEGGEDRINFIFEVIKQIWKGKMVRATNEEKAIIKSIIRNYYKQVNQDKSFPTFRGFYQFMLDFESKIREEEKKFLDFRSLELILKPFSEGEYKYLLNSDFNVNLADQNFVVFDMEAAMKDESVKDLLQLIVIQLAIEKIELHPKARKTMIIDEAIDFLMGDMGDFIAGLYRKIRKRNGQVLLATQGVSYLEDLDNLVKKSIFGNSDIKILLNHKNDRDSYPALMKYLSLTDFDLELLDSLETAKEYREIFIKLGGFSRAFRVELSPFAAGTYSTTADEVEYMRMVFERSGNWVLVINQFIEDKNSGKYKRWLEEKKNVLQRSNEVV
jgi:conjugation system TraG family ATPase